MSEGIDAAAGLLACPVCQEPLDRVPGARIVACAGGHRFDLARQGYLNLLGAPPPTHADTAAMVAARDRFLASGAYAPIAAAIAEAVPSGPLLEVGAGTGHYAARALTEIGSRGIAVDISVAAAKRAARAHPSLASVVADAWKPLPLRSAAFGCVLCVFAPRNLAEFARVLAPGGRLVVVTPNPDHLARLRTEHGLLGIEPDKDRRLARAAAGLFEPIDHATVSYAVAASAAQVRDLMAMGPNAFHRLPDEVEPATLAVSVRLSLFGKP